MPTPVLTPVGGKSEKAVATNMVAEQGSNPDPAMMRHGEAGGAAAHDIGTPRSGTDRRVSQSPFPGSPETMPIPTSAAARLPQSNEPGGTLSQMTALTATLEALARRLDSLEGRSTTPEGTTTKSNPTDKTRMVERKGFQKLEGVRWHDE